METSLIAAVQKNVSLVLTSSSSLITYKLFLSSVVKGIVKVLGYPTNCIHVTPLKDMAKNGTHDKSFDSHTKPFFWLKFNMAFNAISKIGVRISSLFICSIFYTL